MNKQGLRGAVTSFREQLQNEPWTLAATGIGVSAVSAWTGVAFDEVIEPRAEIIAGSLTAATLYLARIAVRKHRERLLSQIPEQNE